MSQIDLPFSLRIEAAARYYDFQVKSADLPWPEVLSQIESNADFGIPEVLVLLNPKYYEELNASDPRGERSYPSVPNSFICRSEEVWGYACAFKNASIHVDHMFPHSKGGSTTSSNAMHLCAEHNMSKHTDIHLIPWEKLPSNNEWITNSLKHLLNYSQKLSAEKLFMPQRQLKQI